MTDFRDQLVAASLKREPPGIASRRERDFRDQLVAASLKRLTDDDQRLLLDAFPRPTGRGLIEAGTGADRRTAIGAHFRDQLVAASLKHRPNDIGLLHLFQNFRDQLVAASLKLKADDTVFEAEINFRDQLVAASLKRQRHQWRLYYRQRISATNWSRPH